MTDRPVIVVVYTLEARIKGCALLIYKQVSWYLHYQEAAIKQLRATGQDFDGLERGRRAGRTSLTAAAAE